MGGFNRQCTDTEKALNSVPLLLRFFPFHNLDVYLDIYFNLRNHRRRIMHPPHIVQQKK